MLTGGMGHWGDIRTYTHPLTEMGKIKLLTKWSKYFVITKFV